jgi:hypothetical protein
VVVFLAVFSGVRPTNFGGFDEWLILELTQRGILAYPHSNRIHLGLAPALLAPCSILTYHWLTCGYYLLSAFLTWRIARRLLAGQDLIATAAAVLVLTWAPWDMGRLDTVQMAGPGASGLAAALLAIDLWLSFVERGGRQRLGLALVVAFLVTRNYEAVLGLLGGATLLLLLVTHAPRERWPRAILAWQATILLGLLLTAWPFVFPSPESAYQANVLKIDLDPVRYLERLAALYRLNLWPLRPESLASLAAPPVLVATFAWVLGGFLLAREEQPVSRRRLAALAILGLAFAGLTYAIFAVSPALAGPTRTQILSGPGIALFLAGLLALLASWAGPRASTAVFVAGTAWIVASGAARTAEMQRAWDATSYYARQAGTLRQLVELAPGLRPGTLVLLLDEAKAWPASFTFRHAVALVYGDTVVGHVAGRDPLLYSLVARPEGLLSVPWPVLRAPWRVLPVLHAWDAIVAVRLTTEGRLELLERFERGLPHLPVRARYAPRERILEGSLNPCAQRALAAFRPERCEAP